MLQFLVRFWRGLDIFRLKRVPRKLTQARDPLQAKNVSTTSKSPLKMHHLVHSRYMNEKYSIENGTHLLGTAVYIISQFWDPQLAQTA